MDILTYYHPLEMMDRILSDQILAEKTSYKITEESDSFFLKMPLPGLTKKDLEIEVSGGILSISGKKTDFSWTEDFQKRFRLPDSVDTDSVEAKLENGILILTIQKKKESIPRKISVK
jgi:HSP20 family protein